MKKMFLLSIVLFLVLSIEAKFGTPFGAEITGAGSTAVVDYMKALINAYNFWYPCPKLVYQQKPLTKFSGSTQGVDRVLDGSVTFAVSDGLASGSIADSSCLVQIPFIATSLSIIYHLPNDFTPSNQATWPGHLNISFNDLLTIYTNNSALDWGTLLNRSYNGTQTYTGTHDTTPVVPFALSKSDNTTGYFVNYLTCSFSSTPIVSTYPSFLVYAANDQNGPFCYAAPPFLPTIPAWDPAVFCVESSDMIAAAVTAIEGSIGYVPTGIACTQGFFPGSPNGIPLGVSGLFDGTGNPLNRANYVQPTTAFVSAAFVNTTNPSCTDAQLCIPDAYPIVYPQVFALSATQTAELISCNIAQFIEFALTEGQKLNVCGFVPLPCDCIALSLAQLDQINAAVCNPCVEPCNPCLNQTCPLPCLPCCKS